MVSSAFTDVAPIVEKTATQTSANALIVARTAPESGAERIILSILKFPLFEVPYPETDKVISSLFISFFMEVILTNYRDERIDPHHVCAVATVVDNSISGIRVARELDRIAETRGHPHMIVSDNGTELTSNAILKWSEDARVEWHYI